MFAFEVLGRIESAIGPVTYRIERKDGVEAIVLSQDLDDVQIDTALFSVAHMIGNIEHTNNQTRIELI